MEAAGHRRSRILFRVSLIRLVLLLLCTSIPAVTLLTKAEEPTCQEGKEFLTDDSICCEKCPAGFKLVENCHEQWHKSNCAPCPDGQYLDQINFARNCMKCKRCKENEVVVSPCKSDKNTICRCEDGFYKYNIDSLTYECNKCTACEANENLIQQCCQDSNTRCECKENYYRVKNKCLPCTNCSAGCRHFCTDPKTTTDINMTELKQTLATEGYDVTNTSKQVTVQTDINQKRKVQARNKSKERTGTIPPTQDPVTQPKPTAATKNKVTRDDATKKEKPQMQATATAKPENKSNLSTNSKPKAKTRTNKPRRKRKKARKRRKQATKKCQCLQ